MCTVGTVKYLKVLSTRNDVISSLFSSRVSRSETSGVIPSSQGSSVQAVSEYMTDELVCEGSELCFEEIRAEKYFRRLQEKKEKEHREISKLMVINPTALR